MSVAGQEKSPLEAGAFDILPYLPDVLARGAALRDLPGAPPVAAWRRRTGAGRRPICLPDPGRANPRPGSAALVGFGGGGDWQNLQPFRLALADGSGSPDWDPQERVLTVPLPKAHTVVPLSSYLPPRSELMGVWQWLREFIDLLARFSPGRLSSNPAVRWTHRALPAARCRRRALDAHPAAPAHPGPRRPAADRPPEFTALTVQRRPYGTKSFPML